MFYEWTLYVDFTYEQTKKKNISLNMSKKANDTFFDFQNLNLYVDYRFSLSSLYNVFLIH
jgi:hypothetical protein